LSPCTSINSNGSRALTSDLKRAGNTLKAIGIGNNYLNRNPAAQQLRERIEKWDYMKLNSFCTIK
jgi:hypothetical protein